MGKKIDAFVLTLAVAAGLYFYFLGALRSRIAAILLALACCALLGKLLKRLLALLSRSGFLRRRRVRRCASGALMRLACMDEAEAKSKLAELLRAGYGAECALELIQLHPSSSLPEDRLFEAWRAHRGESQLAICATCAADAEARALASGLRAPRVALVDGAQLRKLIAEHSEGFDCGEAAPAHRLRPKLRRVAARMLNRRNVPRGLLFTGAMLLMYALSGSLAYLIGAMALLFVSLIALRRPPRPEKLF